MAKELRPTIVRLLSNMASAKEIQQYLKRFSQVDAERFALVKVGGAILRDEMEALVSSLAFLQQVGLTPIVLHGAGPQLDEEMKAAGITKQTVDGDPGLEGYFYEHDHDLLPEQRLRFARNEHAPEFDPALAPELDSADWPEERLAKAYRNYAMEYVRSSLPETIQLWGTDTAMFVAGGTGRLVGMQLYRRIADELGTPKGRDAATFADFMARFAAAQGDRVDIEADGDTLVVRQTG